MLCRAEEKEMCPTCPTPTFYNRQKHNFIIFLLFQQRGHPRLLQILRGHMCIRLTVFILGKISRVDISGKLVPTLRLAIPVLIRQNTPAQRSYTALLRFELAALDQKRKFQRPGSNARDKSSIQMCRDGRFWVVSQWSSNG